MINHAQLMSRPRKPKRFRQANTKLVAKRCVSALVASILASWFVVFQAEVTTLTARQDAAVEAGAMLFQNAGCSSSYCHGNSGEGGGGPALRDRKLSPASVIRAISEGVPGTAMPAYGKRYSPEQIRQLAAYVNLISGGKPEEDAGSTADGGTAHFSKTKPDKTASPASTLAAPAAKSATIESVDSETAKLIAALAARASAEPIDLRGDARIGRQLFYDKYREMSCRNCHTVGDRGGKLGPDLTGIGGRPAREVFRSIVAPHAAIDPAYLQLALTTRDGVRYVGMKRDENAEVVRFYDMSALPPVSRSIAKSNIARIERLNTSIMPHDFASRYTLSELLNIVTFLKSHGGSSAEVSIKDLF